MSTPTPTTRARYLRQRLNALALDLAHHTNDAAERRAVKLEIRAAEIELTGLAVAS